MSKKKIEFPCQIAMSSFTINIRPCNKFETMVTKSNLFSCNAKNHECYSPHGFKTVGAIAWLRIAIMIGFSSIENIKTQN